MTRKLKSSDLNSMTDAELLALRFCDLPLTIGKGQISERIEKLYGELADRDLKFKPHFWLSSEWFSPDGIPGIAIPFYLAHHRLAKLEQRQMLEVEGEQERECMKILRHEAGHAIDSAFRLHRKQAWRKLFGSFTKKYPKHYLPKPDSRHFVLHLNNWYAQAHPAEDFAETFAVWLTPNSKWRQHYAAWPAMRKLEYVNQLMASLAGVTQPVRNRKVFEPLDQNKKTLARHYRERKAHYGAVSVDLYSRDLHRLFSSAPVFMKYPSAASVIRKLKPELLSTVSYWTGTYRYAVDQVIEAIIERSKEQKLRLTRSETRTRQDLITLVTAITMTVIHSGQNRVAL